MWASARLAFRSPLAVSLLVAALHGLWFTAVAPPWAHYDEPSHFEYARLIAQLGRVPGEADISPELRFDLARSMVNAGFYRHLPAAPDLSPGAPTPNLGYSQVGDAPAYYLLAAIPIRLTLSRSVETQVYAARLLSVLLLLVSVTAAWGVARALTPAGHALVWLVPLSAALVPAFVDLMTAINNDALAVAMGSLWMWASASLLSDSAEPPRGRRAWLGVAGVLGSAAAAAAAKADAAVLALVCVPVLLLHFLRGHARPLAWAGVAASAALLLLATVGWGDSAFWYRSAALLQDQATRCSSCAGAPSGAAIVIRPDGGANPRLTQPLPVPAARAVAGQSVTVGAWMWIPDGDVERAEASAPVLRADRSPERGPRVMLSREPRFIAYTATLPAGVRLARLVLEPYAGTGPRTAVGYAGMVAVVGLYPTGEAPRFADSDGARGTWGGREFENLARNEDGARAWFMLRPAASRLLQRAAPAAVEWSFDFGALQDWAGSQLYREGTAFNLLSTFWATFGWNHVRLPTVWYSWLGVITVIGLISAAGAWLARRRPSAAAVACLAAGAALCWLAAYIRGQTQTLSDGAVYLPVARYAYPAIVPTLLALNFGWLALWRATLGRFPATRRLAVPVWATAWAILLIAAWLAAARGYWN